MKFKHLFTIISIILLFTFSGCVTNNTITPEILDLSVYITNVELMIDESKPLTALTYDQLLNENLLVTFSQEYVDLNPANKASMVVPITEDMISTFTQLAPNVILCEEEAWIETVGEDDILWTNRKYSIAYEGYSVPIILKQSVISYILINETTGTITKLNTTDSIVILPSKYNDIVITGISPTAFSQPKTKLNVKEIIIPDTINIISPGTFDILTNLEKVTFSGKLSQIPSSVFDKNLKLSEISILNSSDSNYYSLKGVLFLKNETLYIWPKNKSNQFVIHVLDLTESYDITVSYGSLYSLPFTNNGYSSFLGYYLNSDILITDSQGLSLNKFNYLSDLTVISKYAFETYSVTFIADGDVISFQVIEYGKSANNPTYDNYAYTFLGWDKDTNFITETLVVNAILIHKKVEITYDYGQLWESYYQCSSIFNEVINYGSTPTLPVPDIPGYALSWSECPTNVINDIQVFAIWNSLEYTVFIDPNFGEIINIFDYSYDYTNTKLTKKIFFNENINSFPEISKNGYSLSWHEPIINHEDKTITIVAIWNPLVFSVILMSVNDTDIVTLNNYLKNNSIYYTKEIFYGDDKLFPELHRDGFVCTWQEIIINYLERTMTFEPVWLSELYSHQLKLDGGSILETESYQIITEDLISKSVLFDQILKLPTLTKNGYDYTWSTPEFNHVEKIIYQVAIWSPATFLLKIKLNGGSLLNSEGYDLNNDYATKNCVYLDILDYPEITLDGWELTWNPLIYNFIDKEIILQTNWVPLDYTVILTITNDVQIISNNGFDVVGLNLSKTIKFNEAISYPEVSLPGYSITWGPATIDHDLKTKLISIEVYSLDFTYVLNYFDANIISLADFTRVDEYLILKLSFSAVVQYPILSKNGYSTSIVSVFTDYDSNTIYLEAVFSPESYKVMVTYNEEAILLREDYLTGENYLTKTVLFDSEFSYPVLQRLGYTLSWSEKNVDHSSKTYFVNPIWIPLLYSIVVNCNNFLIEDIKDFEVSASDPNILLLFSNYGEDYTLPILTNPGYDLSWSIDVNHSESIIIHTPNWQSKKYSVILDSSNGEIISFNGYISNGNLLYNVVNYDQLIYPILSFPGYELTWDLTEINHESQIIIIIAKWKPLTYRLIFEFSVGILQNISDFMIEIGYCFYYADFNELPLYPNVLLVGHSLSWGSPITNHSNKTLIYKALWTALEYELIINVNPVFVQNALGFDIYENRLSKTILYSDEYNLPILKRDGFTVSLDSVVISHTDRTIIISPRFNSITYSITYYLLYKNLVLGSPLVINYQTSENVLVLIENPIISNNAFRFIGWFDNSELNGLSKIQLPINSFGNKVFYSSFELITLSISIDNPDGISFQIIEWNNSFDELIRPTTENLNGKYIVYLTKGSAIKLGYKLALSYSNSLVSFHSDNKLIELDGNKHFSFFKVSENLIVNLVNAILINNYTVTYPLTNKIYFSNKVNSAKHGDTIVINYLISSFYSDSKNKLSVKINGLPLPYGITAVTIVSDLEITFNSDQILPNIYKINTFDYEGNILSSVYLHYGEFFVTQTPTDTLKYIFQNKWRDDLLKEYDGNIYPESNLNLYPVFKIKQYEIEITGDAFYPYTRFSKDYGSKLLSVLPNLNIESHIFNGWVFQEEFINDNDILTTNIQISASWSVKKFQVYFNYNRYVEGRLSETYIEFGGSITLDLIPFDGYSQSFYTIQYTNNKVLYKSAENRGISNQQITNIKSHIVISLNGEFSIDIFKVVFTSDSDVSLINVAYAEQYVSYGRTIINTPESNKTGFVIKNWKDADNKMYNLSEILCLSITKDFIFKVIFSERTYVVQYFSGNQITPLSNDAATYKSSFIPKSPIIEPYFLFSSTDWFFNSTFVNRVNLTSFVPLTPDSSIITLYPKITTPLKYGSSVPTIITNSYSMIEDLTARLTGTISIQSTVDTIIFKGSQYTNSNLNIAISLRTKPLFIFFHNFSFKAPINKPAINGLPTNLVDIILDLTYSYTVTINVKGTCIIQGGEGWDTSISTHDEPLGYDGFPGQSAIKSIHPIIVAGTGNLTLKGGNGQNGEMGIKGSSGSVGTDQGLFKAAGTGGTGEIGGTGGKGGSGGVAVLTPKITIQSGTTVNLIGGNGGAGGTGGTGGTAGRGGDGAQFFMGGTGGPGGIGGQGGTGGAGGIGGDAYLSTLVGSTSSLINGTKGAGGNGGTGGRGGEGGAEDPTILGGGGPGPGGAGGEGGIGVEGSPNGSKGVYGQKGFTY